jgi:phosphoglycolate phosphatase-like HAD superfamily hydrolase
VIRVVVFDFDGVLIDSNDVKYGTFLWLFPQDEQSQHVVRSILERHRESSRYDLLRAIVAELEDDKHTPEGRESMVATLAERYSDTVEATLLARGVDPSLRVLLEELSREGRTLYVNSGTPLEPLRRLVNMLQLRPFFRDVYGCEGDKGENLRDVLTRERVMPYEVLAIGDGENDRRAANHVGCHFVGVRNPFNRWADSGPFLTIDDVTSVRDVIRELDESSSCAATSGRRGDPR